MRIKRTNLQMKTSKPFNQDSTQAIHQEVHKDMECPEHPIQVGAVNLCALLHAEKLSSLTVSTVVGDMHGVAAANG